MKFYSIGFNDYWRTAAVYLEEVPLGLRLLEDFVTWICDILGRTRIPIPSFFPYKVKDKDDWKFMNTKDGWIKMNEWYELTRMTGGDPIIIERVRVEKKGIVVEGSFELPPLARLTMEDQIFVVSFIRCHGSIKEMEEMFGISYPTVKNRLNKIAQKLEFVEINPPTSRNEILEQLEKGEISVDDALEKAVVVL